MTPLRVGCSSAADRLQPGWPLGLQRVSIRRMEERARRIVDAAIELAEQGGFEAVRLRDVVRT